MHKFTNYLLCTVTVVGFLLLLGIVGTFDREAEELADAFALATRSELKRLCGESAADCDFECASRYLAPASGVLVSVQKTRAVFQCSVVAL
jgi:hypothetical protein